MQHDFVLLDRSGSMATDGKWVESIKAINDYVKKLADDNVDTGVTLAAFDKERNDLDYAILRDRITPKTWAPVSDSEVFPRGWTPLNDAIGRMVADANAGKYDKVSIVIITDGQENSSKEVTTAKAKKLLQECRDKGWQVIFLGADYDNMDQAEAYGNLAGQTVSADVGSLRATMSMYAEKRSTWGATGQAVAFSDEEKKKVHKTK